MGPRRGWQSRWRRDGSTLLHLASGRREADLCYCRTVPIAAQRLARPGGATPLSTYDFLDLTDEQKARWHRHYERDNFARQQSKSLTDILGLTEAQQHRLQAEIAARSSGGPPEAVRT